MPDTSGWLIICITFPSDIKVSCICLYGYMYMNPFFPCLVHTLLNYKPFISLPFYSVNSADNVFYLAITA